jgi:hypothetical protein
MQDQAVGVTMHHIRFCAHHQDNCSAQRQRGQRLKGGVEQQHTSATPGERAGGGGLVCHDNSGIDNSGIE